MANELYQQSSAAQRATCPPAGQVLTLPTEQVAPQIQDGIVSDDFVNRALEGKSFSQVVPQIRGKLLLRSELDIKAISLQETTAREEVESLLKSTPLFSRVGSKEFRKVASFSVPAGERILGLDTYRFDYNTITGIDQYGQSHNRIQNYTGFIENRFHYSRELRERMHNLYEVHVERKNGRDFYTIAFTERFVGGLRLTVDGKSVLLLSHEEDKRSAPKPKNSDSPPVKQKTPPPPLATKPKPSPLQNPDEGISSPSDRVVTANPLNSEATLASSLPESAKESESGSEAPRIAAKGRSPESKIPPSAILGSIPPLPPPPLAKASQNNAAPKLGTELALPQLASSNKTKAHLASLNPPSAPKGATPLGMATQKESNTRLFSLPPLSSLNEKKDELESPKLATPPLSTQVDSEKLRSLGSRNLPGNTPVLRVPDIAVRPEFSLKPVTPVRVPVEFDKEQRRALLGGFSMKMLIFQRKDFSLPYDRIQALGSSNKRLVDKLTSEIYPHAYNPPEYSFGLVAALSKVDPRPGEPKYKEDLETAIAATTLALNGRGPDPYSGIVIEGAGKRAEFVDRLLPTLSPWISEKKSEGDYDTDGKADVRDLETFVRRMRGVVPYLQSNQIYLAERYAAEVGDSKNLQSALSLRGESGYHRDVEKLSNSLSDLFSDAHNPIRYEQALSDLSSLSDWRPWEFTDNDVQAMEGLIKQAEASKGLLSTERYSLGFERLFPQAASPVNQTQGSRGSKALVGAREFLDNLKVSRQAQTVCDNTDLACVSFLKLAPNLHFGEEPPAAGAQLEKKDKELNGALLHIDRELALLKTMKGDYAKWRTEMLQQRRSDMREYIELQDPELLTKYPDLKKRLDAPQKEEAAPLNSSGRELEQVLRGLLVEVSGHEGLTRVQNSLRELVDFSRRRQP